MPNKLRIGTRPSKLAVTQTHEILQLLKSHTSQEIEIVTIASSGDKIQDRNLATIGGKGLFIKELEEALLQNKIDIAIHSAKDVPPVIADGTVLSSFSKRSDPRDCIISKDFFTVGNLPQNAIIGTSSPRRKAILLHHRPDLQIVNFRGNVDTRLSKIEQKLVDASILALCGLKRLNRLNEVKMIFETNEMLPAAGQGCLAIQIRKDDNSAFQITRQINDEESEICINAERAFLYHLGASCFTPVAALAIKKDNLLQLETLVLSPDGNRTFHTQSQANFTIKDGIALGTAAANKTRTEAGELMKELGLN